ncbi:DUF1176 domain-containing protein [Enterobacter cloacae subsp. dissolvens]
MVLFQSIPFKVSVTYRFPLYFFRFIVVFSTLYANLAFCAIVEPEVHLNRKNWELTCDNIQTCRAVGVFEPYSAVLIRRTIDHIYENEVALALPESQRETQSVELYIDNYSLGELTPISGKSKKNWSMNEKQLHAFISALNMNQRVDFIVGKNIIEFSTAGASDVLAKMDTFQLEKISLPSTIIPGSVVDKTLRKATSVDLADLQHKLMLLLSADDYHMTDEGCPVETMSANDWKLAKLDENRTLFFVPCWYSPYNKTHAVVVYDDNDQDPLVVTYSATGYENGNIYYAMAKIPAGCFSYESWVWNGSAFVHYRSGELSKCGNGISGNWPIPTLEITVEQEV